QLQRDVRLGMSGGKQQQRHRVDVADTLASQQVPAFSDVGSLQFQQTTLDRHRSDLARQQLGQSKKLLVADSVSRPVADQQHAAADVSSSRWVETSIHRLRNDAGLREAALGQCTLSCREVKSGLVRQDDLRVVQRTGLGLLVELHRNDFVKRLQRLLHL